MSLTASSLADHVIAQWPPIRFSAPLSSEFTSDGDWLLQLVDLTWRNDDGSKMILDPWQRSLIRHALETYPPGHEKAGQLRYRECFVSVGRQNGKSVIGAILAMYGLLRAKGALVIGLASSADQARIVYERLLAIIKADKRLAKRFKKATDTRGIVSNSGSRYEIKASKSGAVQGLATSLGIIDELHITSPALWTDLVNGTAATKGMVFGITTAGDEESALLISLYKRAEEPTERFGYFIWEAPGAYLPDDDQTLAEFLSAANPSIGAGRRPIEDEIEAVRSFAGGDESEADLIHYRLNRFVASLNPYLPPEKWNQRTAPEGYVWPIQGPLVFSLDQTPEDGFATITAHRKTPDGHHHTEIVCTILNPTLEALVKLCEQLWRWSPSAYTGEGYKLRPVLNELKKRGYPVRICGPADAINAASLLYRQVMNGDMTHAGDALLSLQVPRAVKKNKGDVYSINRASSSVEIDALMATAFGTLVLDEQQELTPQVFSIK